MVCLVVYVRTYKLPPIVISRDIDKLPFNDTSFWTKRRPPNDASEPTYSR